MKIVYSAGNCLGAGLQLRQFLRAIDSKCEVKIAAFLRSGQFIDHVDWTLDALFNTLGMKGSQLVRCSDNPVSPKINSYFKTVLFEQLADFDPDLVICDGEAVLANWAKIYDVKLVYASSLHALNGSMRDPVSPLYFSKMRTAKRFLLDLPAADLNFIVSPWPDLIIKDGWEQIRPYTIPIKNESVAVILDKKRTELKFIVPRACPELIVQESIPFKHTLSTMNQGLTCGESVVIESMIELGVQKLLLATELNDWESIINAKLMKEINWGVDLGNIESGDQVLQAQELDWHLQRLGSRKLNRDNFPTVQLHDKILELENK